MTLNTGSEIRRPNGVTVNTVDPAGIDFFYRAQIRVRILRVVHTGVIFGLSRLTCASAIKYPIFTSPDSLNCIGECARAWTRGILDFI